MEQGGKELLLELLYIYAIKENKSIACSGGLWTYYVRNSYGR